MSSDIVKTLRYIILGDATKLSNTLRNSSRDLRGFGKSGGVFKTLKADIVGAVKSGEGMKGVGAAFKKAGGEVGGIGGAAKMAGIGIASAGAAAVVAGAAIAIKFGQKSVDTFKRVAGEVLGLKRVTGMTAEEASRLAFSFQQTGIDAGAGNKALTIFAKNLGKMADQDEKAKDKAAALAEKTKAQIEALKGASKHGADYKTKLAGLQATLETATHATSMNVSALGEMGVTYADSTGKIRPMAQLLPQIADWFAKTKDGPEKAAMAMKLFGKSGTQLLPFLNKGAAGLKELADKSDKFGNTLNDKQLDALKKSKVAQRDFDAAMQGLQVTLGSELLPVLTEGANALNSVLVPALQMTTSWVKDNSSTFEAMGHILTWLWNNILLPTVKAGIIGYSTFNRVLSQGVQALGALTGNKDLETFGAGLVKMNDDAINFANSLQGIPTQVAPKIDVKDDATAKVKTIDSRIKSLKGKLVTAKAKGDAREVEKLQSQISALKSKKVTIEANVKKTGISTISINQKTKGWKISAYARGGAFRPGWAWVGEQGPELVRFAGSGRVYTASQSRQMIARQPVAGASGGVNVNFNISVSPGGERQAALEIRRMLLNLKATLGQKGLGLA